MKCKECGCPEEVHSEDWAALLPCVECQNCHGFVPLASTTADEPVDITKCRARKVPGDESFHVGYATTEDDPNFAGSVETRNLTHQEVVADDFDERGEYECAWVAQIENGCVQLLISEDGGGFDVHQNLTAETCLQLADLFLSSAKMLLEREAENQAKEDAIQKVIDSQNLPFGEPPTAGTDFGKIDALGNPNGGQIVEISNADRRETSVMKAETNGFQNQIPDLEKWFCETMKRNYWTLGYFGGGAINLAKADRIAAEFHKETAVDSDSVTIEEISSSRKMKYFKVLSSNQENQFPLPDAQNIENFWHFARG